jgi:hypothetical protein
MQVNACLDLSAQSIWRNAQPANILAARLGRLDACVFMPSKRLLMQKAGNVPRFQLG